MPHVNLVPQSERRLAVRRQMLVFPAAGAAALVLLLGGSYLYYNNKLSNTNDDLNMYKQNNANLAKQVSELQKYEDLKNQKQARLSAVASAYQARFRWSRLLDDVSFVIPETISLEKMIGKVPGAAGEKTATSSKATERDLEFDGRTRAMPEVATFMVRLSLIPSITDVTLKMAEVEESGGPVHFVINATLNTVGETQRPAVAPTTGESGPSPVTPTGTTQTAPRTTTVGTATDR